MLASNSGPVSLQSNRPKANCNVNINNHIVINPQDQQADAGRGHTPMTRKSPSGIVARARKPKRPRRARAILLRLSPSHPG